MKKITIYALTHKQFIKPDSDTYKPLFVGASLHTGDKVTDGVRSAGNDVPGKGNETSGDATSSKVNGFWGYLTDNTGDNISEKNIYYSELTGHYWIWKNDHASDIVGTCHYRRYLMDENGHIMDRPVIENLLEEYDVITTKRVHLNNSYYYGFCANHNQAALNMTGEVIKDLYPDDYDLYVRMVNDDYTHFSNMLITSKKLFDEYCTWLFNIFFEVENRISLDTDEDSYHKRVLGFISEFLLGVWLRARGYSSYECKVAVMCEKKEVTETKDALADFFANRDIAGAKEYLLNAIALRPDILHEAADITGELHIAMQIISTCEFEMAAGKACIIEKITDFRQLVEYFSVLNNCVNDEVVIPPDYSDEAVLISKKMYGKK